MKRTTTIGDRLKTLRESLSLTQEQLSQKSGISKDHISKVERNEQSNLRVESLKKLAEALGVSSTELLSAN